MPDQRARIVHQLDQLSGVLRELAPVLRGFYDELIAQKFTPEQALELVKSMQNHLLTAARKRADGDIEI